MKRKSLLFLLLLALGLPWAANAQETLTVCDGSVEGTTTTTNDYVPIYGLYVDTQGQNSEFIIPAETQGMSDMEGGTISKLAFYITNSPGSWGSPTVQVYMGEVEGTTLSSLNGPTNFTTVWTGSLSNQDATMEITLSTPYTYGGGNLLIGMYVQTRSTTYKTTTFSGITAPSGSSRNNSGSGNGTAREFLPKTTFTYEPANTDCPNPKTLVASDVTAHGVTMTWTMEDETGDYQFNLEYKKTTQGDNEWERIGLRNTRTYPLTGLDAETEYQVRIQTACDPENTYWKNGSNFTTLVACPAPTGLSVTDGSVTANEATITWEGTSSDGYVVMIGEEEIAMSTIDFENQAIPYSITNDAARPWTVTAGGANGSGYCIIPGNKGVNSSSSDLKVEVTGPCTVSFMAKVSSESNWDYGRFLIDGTQQMQISGTQDWTPYSYELTEGTHTLIWRYYKDSSGASGNDLFYVDDITIPVTSVPSWTEYTTTDQTYTFENLTPNTSYQVKVKGNCGSEGYSVETEPVSFTTEVSCTAPTGLAIVEGSLTAHEVTIAWDAEEGDVFEYILTAEPSVTPENAVFNTTTPTHNEHWNSLAGDTDYFFFLRKKCGDTDFSEILTLTFHTLIACPAPTGLQVVEGSITARGASFSWNAEEGATFQYYTIENPWADFEPTEETIWTDITENTVGWTNAFSPNTLQRFYLRKDCGDVDGYSDYVYVEFRTLQEPVSVPFVDDFEDGQQWVFVNGNLTNAWAYGEATNNGETGTHAMYISNDGGTSNTYSISSAAMVYATKLFTFEDGVYVFSYDWKTYGESTYDYLRVALVPASVTLTAGTSAPSVPSGSFYNNLPEGWIALDGGGKLNLQSDWQSYETPEMSIEAGTYMMVFAWRDDTSGGSNPPAAVDNVSIAKITCSVPTGLAYANVKSNKVDLTWTSDATAWQLCLNGDEDNLVDVTANDVTINEGVVTYTLEGLTETTEYTVKVRANCGSEDGVSAWTAPVSFTTMAACSVEDVTISNIGHYTADVNWMGDSEDGFTVQYRIPESLSLDGIIEDFEDGTMPAGWTTEGLGTWTVGTGDYSTSTGAHGGTYNAKINHGTTGNVTYLVTPNLDLSGQRDLNVNLWYINRSWSGDIDGFGVYYRINGGEWNEIFATIENHESWTEVNEALPAGAYTTNCQIGFQFTDGYGYGVSIDDITLGNPSVIPAGEWQTVTTDENTANLSGLTMGTTYDLTVVPNCDETLASEIQQFTTISENEKYFITAGDWSTAANWEPAGAPTIEQNVTLFANATITGEAEAKSIAGTGTGEGTYTLTIENGGKLKHLNSGVRATVKKTIRGYNTNYDSDTYNNGDYYLIANPLTSSVTPSADNGFLVGNYDLYSWNYTLDDEWRNYEASTFTLSSGSYGYLYANENGTELTYTGTINAYTSYKYRSCSTANSPENFDYPSWYLLGNPYLYDAYLANTSTSTGSTYALPYIKMNEAGDGFENVAAGTPIAPMEGFFYQGVTGATNTYVVTFEPTVQDEGKLNMNLRKGNKQLDNAILVFGGNQQMGKMTFRANSSRVYMPVDGKDYAIVSTESNIGEMPVSFKAENNGTYTLSFNADEVSFAYLHLIDNMTGIETDLLANPSYSFEASTTDYESRFKLVFATGNNANDDAFAFYSNGNFVINNEGNATLQVIDINGRILKSENINGCANVNVKAAAGIYMLRLVNGNDVKVQKVVVR